MSDNIEKLDNIFDLEELDNEINKLSDVNDAHADQILWKIGHLNHRIDTIKKSQQESVEFYNRRMEALTSQVGRRVRLLEDIMRLQNESLGLKTIKVPNGTMRLTSSTKRKFPDNEEMLKFCDENKLEKGIKTTRTPIKKVIIDYIKNTGDIPEGYEEDTVQSFSYKVGG